jgi:hypothetical protein
MQKHAMFFSGSANLINGLPLNCYDLKQAFAFCADSRYSLVRSIESCFMIVIPAFVVFVV